jgi:uncharacterized protein (TIGR02421 family)
MKLSPERKQKIIDASNLLFEAERPLRVLRSLSWLASIREDFLASCGTKMPVISYERHSYPGSRAALTAARPLLDGDDPTAEWLQDTARSIEQTLDMLEAIGTKEFSHHSAMLYGKPGDLTELTSTSVHDLATFLDQQLERLHPQQHEVQSLDARGFADALTPLVNDFFGEVAPEVRIVDNLSAKALAGRRFIRVHKRAKFTEKDVSQLFHHEAVIHVGTTLNGLKQFDLPSISVPHAGTTKTQEGLAVFAEFMSGSMDPRRMRRLSDRVIAIEMAMNGADFMELYRFFLERTDNPEVSFENSRRVMRGGLLEGGAPFTKDIVYLEGLLRLHQFLKQLLTIGRSDLIPLLFCGKLDIKHLPALASLADNGLIEPPDYLPTWARDNDFLVSFLAYSGFLNQPILESADLSMASSLANAPVLGAFGQ